MLKYFTYFADYMTKLLGLDLSTHLGKATHFFIEDITKIFVMVYVLIFVISLFRSQLSPERVREYLSGKSRFVGYLLAVFLGVFTPFCSCSSIPLFIGFIIAGVPFGVAMAFLVSSPLVSEVAAIILLSMQGAGVEVALLYVMIGSVIAFIGGFLCDLFGLEKYSKYQAKDNYVATTCDCNTTKDKVKATIKYAFGFANDTLKKIGLYIFIGLVLGAFMHGYVPEELFVKYLGRENPFAVPLAAIAGIPIYANHAGIMPIIQVLLLKGVPVGTSLTMLMSITAISLPEMIMLSQVIKKEMIAIFAFYLMVSFVVVGYILNGVL